MRKAKTQGLPDKRSSADRLATWAAEMRWACVRPEYERIRVQLVKIAMDLERAIETLKSGH
jgi:hypothetical protein